MSERKNIEELVKEIKNLNEEELLKLIEETLKFSEDNMKELAFKQKYIIPSNISLVKKYESSKKISLRKFPETLPICDVFIKRKTQREYIDKPLTFSELSTLLIYSYGVRTFAPAYNYLNFPFRTSPSGGGLQSVEVYCVVNRVEEIEEGLYHFDPLNNYLDLIFSGFVVESF